MKPALKILSVALLVSIALLVCGSRLVLGQTPADEAQIRLTAMRFEQAWNKHNMNELAGLFTEDADFVNVGGKHWKGRKEIEKQHTARLSQFVESRWSTKAVTVQFLNSDIALVHVSWALNGDKDPDGTLRSPREGLFTWVVVKRGGVWQIRAAQNTNVSSLPSINTNRP